MSPLLQSRHISCLTSTNSMGENDKSLELETLHLLLSPSETLETILLCKNPIQPTGRREARQRITDLPQPKTSIRLSEATVDPAHPVELLNVCSHQSFPQLGQKKNPLKKTLQTTTRGHAREYSQLYCLQKQKLNKYIKGGVCHNTMDK